MDSSKRFKTANKAAIVGLPSEPIAPEIMRGYNFILLRHFEQGQGPVALMIGGAYKTLDIARQKGIMDSRASTALLLTPVARRLFPI